MIPEADRIRTRIIEMASRPGGVNGRGVRDRFCKALRPQVQRVLAEMLRAGALHQAVVPTGSRPRITLFATRAAATAYERNPSPKRPPQPRQHHAQPLRHVVPAPGWRNQPVDQATMPPVQRCPGWTHDPRYQCAPGATVRGEFTRLGVGRYLGDAR